MYKRQVDEDGAAVLTAVNPLSSAPAPASGAAAATSTTGLGVYSSNPLAVKRGGGGGGVAGRAATRLSMRRDVRARSASGRDVARADASTAASGDGAVANPMFTAHGGGAGGSESSRKLAAAGEGGGDGEV